MTNRLQHREEAPDRDRPRADWESESAVSRRATRGLDLPAKRDTWTLLRELAAKQ
jgi:hypothetical protein